MLYYMVNPTSKILVNDAKFEDTEIKPLVTQYCPKYIYFYDQIYNKIVIIYLIS